MTQTASYDYIICGAGCAGLSLAVHLIESGKFRDKQILLIDKDAKQQNDRTWCFWEKEEGLFESIVFKKWDQLQFDAPGFSKQLAIKPYQYKLIRGLHFYQYCFDKIGQQGNIHFLQAEVKNIALNTEGASVETEEGRYQSEYVFTSIIQPPALQKKDIWMLQHFKGWYIQTEAPVFDASIGTLMDFRTDQKEGTTFFYVLPFSATEALVEYTLFSPHKLEEKQYQTALHHYITKQLGIANYIIREQEFGIIPMTTYKFPKAEGVIVPIGTAGGYTKGSSGYTFQAIQKSSRNLVRSLLETGHPHNAQKDHGRFSFYDAVLLNVLHNRRVEGWSVFTQLFRKNDPRMVLRFLDNETSLVEELKIIASLPTIPFTKAALSQSL